MTWNNKDNTGTRPGELIITERQSIEYVPHMKIVMKDLRIGSVIPWPIDFLTATQHQQVQNRFKVSK